MDALDLGKNKTRGRSESGQSLSRGDCDAVRIPTALTLASWPQASREDPEAAPAEALQPDGSFRKLHGMGVGAPQRAAQVTGRAGQVHARKSTREAGKHPYL